MTSQYTDTGGTVRVILRGPKGKWRGHVMRTFAFLAMLFASVTLANPQTYAQERKGGDLSPVQAQILEFWRDVAPIGLVRAHHTLLGKGIEAPDRGATDAALLKFYSNWAPKRTSALIDRLAQLRYPILDTEELKKQLKLSGRELDHANRIVISNLRATDFPLVSLRRTLNVVVIRELSYGFKSCWDDYQSCRSDVLEEEESEPSIAEQIRCERDYQECTDAQSVSIFVVFYREFLRLWPPRLPR